jgi:hypothetical protein
VGSVDPNSIQGPSGFGPDGFVEPGLFSYGIEFENKPDATAPAQTVVVTQQLDANLDWSTFQLGNIAFGNTVVSVPSGLTSYSTQVDLTATLGLDVDISASFNPLTGLATWTFTSIDPATIDVPTNPLAGFLPPDLANGEGLGFVGYTISPKATLVSGNTIGAQATVVFDQNASLSTAAITNTIDNGPPTSSVAPLPAQSPPTFTVSWSGTDDTGGSGIASYTVYVSDNGGTYTAFQTNTTAISAIFTGQSGHTYAFYSVATDNIGHVQATPTTAQATTTVSLTSIGTTISVSSSENPARAGDAVTFTATVSAAQSTNGTPTGTIQFQVDGSPVGSPVALVNGSASFTPTALSAGNHAVSAIYTPDSGLFIGSNGDLAGGETVSNPPPSSPGSTTSALTASVSSAVFGRLATFTVVVSPTTAGSPAPTGSVSFFDGSTVLGSVALSGGVARFTTAALALGSHSIHAIYAGDTAYAGSQSGAAGVSVRPDATTTVVTPSANPAAVKHALTLTIVVTASAPGGGTPTGTVTFYDGKKSLGTATLGGGLATLTSTKLKLGKHTIIVIYHGDSDFTTSTSPALREVIKKSVKGKKPKARTALPGRAKQVPASMNAIAPNRHISSMLVRDIALERLTIE